MSPISLLIASAVFGSWALSTLAAPLTPEDAAGHIGETAPLATHNGMAGATAALQLKTISLGLPRDRPDIPSRRDCRRSPAKDRRDVARRLRRVEEISARLQHRLPDRRYEPPRSQLVADQGHGARIGAALGMTVEDVFTQNRRLWVRLHERAASGTRCRATIASRNI